MIGKEYGEHYLECDVCGKYIPGFKSFVDALEYAKDMGWKITKGNSRSEWEYICEECNEVD